VDPAAEATTLCADVRPYRESAAAASDEDGRGVGHGPGYKAASPRRQGFRCGLLPELDHANPGQRRSTAATEGAEV